MRSIVQSVIVSNTQILVNANYFKMKFAWVVRGLARYFAEKLRCFLTKFLVRFDTNNRDLKVWICLSKMKLLCLEL
ncbi:MAG: hypothetical protein EAZ61_13480 [Oscillatoriales cyanobacterium]|nr:MAG: hypothetical protein EAZ61_13480 [Oscillatoriales cyanobacterium]